MRLSSATQIQPGIDVVMTTAEDSRQDNGTELVDDLKWSNKASLYTYLCMMRIRPRSAPRCATKQKNVSDFVILSLSQAKKEPAASAHLPRALLVADPDERALAKAAAVDFMESRVPLLEANLANEAWGLDESRTKHLCQCDSTTRLLILSLPSICIQMCALL